MLPTRVAVLDPTALSVTLDDATVRVQNYTESFWQQGQNAGALAGDSFLPNLGASARSNGAVDYSQIISMHCYGIDNDQFLDMNTGVDPAHVNPDHLNACYTNGAFHFNILNGNDSVFPFQVYTMYYYTLTGQVFTGGVTAPAIPPKQSKVFDFGARVAFFDYYNGTIPLAQSTIANPASGTFVAPVWNLANAQDMVVFSAVQDNAGLTLYGAFKWDDGFNRLYGQVDFFANAYDSDGYNISYCVRHDDNQQIYRWKPTSAVGLPSDYTGWFPSITDFNFNELIAGNNYNSFVGTPFGFLMSWQGPKPGPAPYVFYAILIDLDWTAYRYITIHVTGPIGQAILDGAADNTTIPALMLAADGTYYLMDQAVTPTVHMAFGGVTVPITIPPQTVAVINPFRLGVIPSTVCYKG